MNKIIFKSLCAVLTILTFASLQGCEKYLDEKSDKKLAIPSTLTDFQALLDNNTYMGGSPSSGETSSDNYYMTDADWASLSLENHRRMYIWEKDNLFAPDEVENDWQVVYTTIYYANTVLDGLKKLNETSSNAVQRRDIEGQALYFRANAYLDAAIVWTLAYDPSTASTDLGLPLKLQPDFTEKSKRSSLQETYQQIISDLKLSIQKLSPVVTLRFRPNKPAAYGLLARTYLAMRDYNQAYLYADSCLRLYNKLIDYNSLSPSANFPIMLNNDEVIAYKLMKLRQPIAAARAKIDSGLYDSYVSNDLRKEIFFRQNTDKVSYRFKGSYMGSSPSFCGIATDEMYLIRAECNVRLGRVSDGLSDLNQLMTNRFRKTNGKSTYTPLVTTNASNALQIILTERRKELVMRGLRWMDIKRLNKEGGNIALTRTLNKQMYTLPANDFRFALPIPELVIDISGMQQNLR